MSDEGGSSENIGLLWYEAVPSITISDHRPVCAGFDFLPKAPFLLRDGVVRTGAYDECVVLLQGLTFIRAPEPSRAKLTSWQQVRSNLLRVLFISFFFFFSVNFSVIIVIVVNQFPCSIK
jgi:hypothetical protein